MIHYRMKSPQVIFKLDIPSGVAERDGTARGIREMVGGTAQNQRQLTPCFSLRAMHAYSARPYHHRYIVTTLAVPNHLYRKLLWYSTDRLFRKLEMWLLQARLLWWWQRA